LKTQSFLSKYFAAAQERLAHCILFYGADIQAQYDLALDIAKKLNPDEVSQKWLSENKHPAVVTVEKEEGKTAISIEQARAIKSSLASTSDYHRVFIFHDASGLNENNFTEEAANALLKTFEEPPERVTFFFLTKNKEDMLATIISRAQSFYVPPVNSNEPPPSFAPEFEQMQGQMLEQLRTGVSGELPRLIQAIHDIEDAKKQLKLNMNEQTVRETLELKLNS
jgi:DNA polymerase III delta prime subunit